MKRIIGGFLYSYIPLNSYIDLPIICCEAFICGEYRSRTFAFHSGVKTTAR